MRRNGRKGLLVTKCEWWTITAFPQWHNDYFISLCCLLAFLRNQFDRHDFPFTPLWPLPLSHGWISLGHGPHTYCEATEQHCWSGVGFAFINALQLSLSFKNPYAPILALQWYFLSPIILKNPISLPHQMWVSIPISACSLLCNRCYHVIDTN